MKNKFAFIFCSSLLLLAFGGDSHSQTNCTGAKIFTEKNCIGDDVSPIEKELHKIVNDYRAKNNLPPVALSNPLSIVANRHLLDLANNIKSLSHGWSNCPYDIKNQSTWNCLFDSPKRLNVGYNGNGYENLYRSFGGNATPSSALEAWKKSEMHNSLILNLDVWKDTKFDAFGIAISGSYAALWFGSTGDVSKERKYEKKAGLGITFEQTVAGLTKVISIKKASSSLDNEEWSGASSDRSVMLSVVGVKDDISQAVISIRIKIEKNAQISSKNRDVLKTFLNNLIPEWREKDIWIDAAMKDLQQNSKEPQITNQGNKTIVVNIDKENYISIAVKPYRKPLPREIK